MFQLNVVLEQMALAGRRLRRSRAVVFAKNNLSPILSWSAAHRLASAWLIFALLAGNFSAILEQFAKEQTYRLTQESASLLGHNTNLADKLAFDKKTNAYRFNADAVDTANKNLASSPSASADPASGGVPDAVKAQLAMQQNVGASDKKDKQLYGVDLPVNPNKGITVADTNTKLSFTMTPNFPLTDARVVDGRVVYPLLGTDQQAIYSLKNNGLKEDIVLQSDPTTDGNLTYSYALKLPDTLVAKLMPNGAVGIYSADPALFGQITASSPDDQKLIDNARKTAEKNYLVFAMPAPSVRQAGSSEAVKTVQTSFELNKDVLTVKANGISKLSYPISVDPSVVVTSTSDFQLGNNEDNNIDFSTAGQINRGALTGGTTGAWARTSSIATARWGHSTVAYNGFLYVIGGQTGNGTGDLNTVEFATIGTNGSLSAFTTTNPFTTARSQFACTAYNGYLYVISGAIQSTNTYLTSVEYASINTTTGVLTWLGTTGSVITQRTQAKAVAYNGYIYLIGGQNATSQPTSVEFSPIAANGTLSWGTTNSIPSYRFGHDVVAYNGYIYVLGGLTSAGVANTVEYGSINSTTGALTWLGSPGNFTTARWELTSSIYNGYLYVVGGWTTSGVSSPTTSVEYASINANGTLSWRGTTNAFNTTRAFHSTAVYNGYLYIIGGTPDISTSITSVEYVSLAQSGGVGAFNSTATFSPSGTLARYRHTSVAYNGYLYVIGGWHTASDTACNAISGVMCSDVLYAPLNANGTVGTWAATTSFSPTGTLARELHTSVAYNGYLYVIGGQHATSNTACNATASIYCSDVLYASISSNGTVGTWASTTSFSPTGTLARAGHTSVAYNGYMYVIGGVRDTSDTACNATSSNLCSDVLYASISSNGTIGTWASTTSFSPSGALARWTHTTVAYNGYLYVIGGQTPGGLAADVLYASINSNGTVGTWASTTSFSPSGDLARQSHTSVVYNGYLYVIGGFDSAGGTTCNATSSNWCSDILYAPINANGTVGTWATTTSFSPGGTANRVNHTSVAYNGFLYVVGGFNPTAGYFSDVLYSQISTVGAGSSGTWSTTSSFATSRYGHASIAYNGYLYILGGNNAGTYLNTVEYASINATTGALTWITSPAAGNFTTGRYVFAAVAYGGRIYIIGGITTGNVKTASVEVATVASNGTLTWTTTNSIATPRGYHTAVAYNGYMYVLGGQNSSFTMINNVEYASINASTGALTWITSPAAGNFTTARGLHTSVASNGYLYVIGGCDASCNDINSVEYATINTNGTLTWNGTTTTLVGASVENASAVVSNGYIYLVGGQTGGGLKTKNIYKALINSNGALGYWIELPALSVTARSYNAAVYYGGYIYSAGGLDSGGTNATVEFAPVNNGGAGTVGTWTQISSGAGILNTARNKHTSVVYNGYVYVVGGINAAGSQIGSVEYAPLNSNGTVGTWVASSNFLNTARYEHSSVAYNGYIYVIGGQNPSLGTLNSVEYAPLSSNGTVGSWVANSNFNTARYEHASVVYNGYVYAVGGLNAAGSQIGSVEYAPLNSNGTLGTWVTSSNSLNTARYEHSAVAYNGYIYVIGGQNPSLGTLNSTEYAPLNVQPRVASYSKLIDIGSSQLLTGLVYNGTLLGGGAVNVSWASAATSAFGATTTVNNVSPGATVALSGTGRYVWLKFTMDDSAAGTFADSVAGQSFITDITLNYTSAVVYGDPTKRLRGGAYFDPSTGVLQRLNP